jgi:hypothetical protein
VLKNYAIARVGLGLKAFARQNEDGQTRRAIESLDRGIRFARKRFSAGDDPDIDRVVELARGYLDQARGFASASADD